MITGPVSSAMAERVQSALQKHRVVIWYDAERAFENLFEVLAPPRAKKLRLGASYFRLRREVEDAVGQLRAGTPEVENVLVYIPAERLDSRQNVLLPVEVLGRTVEDSLYAVARSALRGRIADAKLAEWRRLPNLTLAKWNELAEAEEDIGALDAVFGKVDPRQVAFQFLRYEEKAQETDRQLLLEPLRALLERTFGVSIPEEVQNAARVRDAFAQRVLLHEFLSDLDGIPPELAAFSLPEPASRVTACRDVAELLRETKGLEVQYREWAQAAVRLFGLDRLEYDAEKLGQRDTFEFEADYALRHVQKLALEDRWEEAREWIANRIRSFWADADQERAERWRLARLATELWLAADSAAVGMPAKKQSPRTWIEGYTAKDGGWRVDLLLRRVHAGLGVLPPGEELATLIDRATERAEALEQTQAERFFDSVTTATGALAELPTQSDVYAKQVAPLVGRSKTVFVLADALRFEMAHELAELLEPTGMATLSFAVATPPTITKVGMAALVPGAEQGISFAASEGGMIPTVAGDALPGLPQRIKRFEAELGSQVKHLTLDECLSVKIAQLEKRCDGVRLLLLRAQELDAIGEMDNLHKARTLMGAVIPDLRQAINRLAHLGFEEFVVCADHGFLLRQDISDAMKLDKPAGEVIETHRRCVVGRDLGAGKHHVVLKSAAFGIGGDLELAFPRGINIFKTQGNMVYHHGGLSLQELVVPVLSYTPTVRREAPKKPAVSLELKGAKKISNAIFQVALTYQGQDLFDQSMRRLRVTAVELAGGKQIGETMMATEGFRESGAELELESGQTSMLVIKLTDPPTGAGEMELQVADVEAGETILRKKVKYDLAF